MSWLTGFNNLLSMGQTSDKANSLGDLHRRRQETQGQFFTPAWISQGIWSVLTPNIDAVLTEDAKVSVVDTSVGSGRLLEWAPENSKLFGIDIDARCIDALCDAAQAHDLNYEFATSEIENLIIHNMSIAVINPPFSLHLESPNMQPYDCTSYGRHGPNTSANSHEYALAQALAGAGIVAALLPRTMEAICRSHKRLTAVFVLPKNSFKEEGAELIDTAVYLFDSKASQSEPVICHVAPGNDWSAITLRCPVNTHKEPVFKVNGVDYCTPTITLPVTDDKTVRLHHHNRRIILQFRCGLTQARVLNGILDGPVERSTKHRTPANIQYRGDGKLLLDVYLVQEDPDAAFKKLLAEIRHHDGQPIVSPTLAGFWHKLQRRHIRAMTPFSHTIKTSVIDTVQLKAKRSSLLIQGKIKSPVIKRDSIVTAIPRDGEYEITIDGWTVRERRDLLEKRFIFLNDERVGAEWQLIHPGLCQRFPELAKEKKARLVRLGIDWLWDYQIDGALELLINSYGAIAAWEMGLGKARLGVCLCLAGGAYNLIVVESGLTPEMVIELEKKIRLDKSLWQVISGLDDIDTLKKINIVSYNTLKKKVRGKKNLAQLLRRRFHTVIADEGGLLANPNTQQARAMRDLSPRKLIIFDGTPMRNYPRNMLPLAAAAAGDGIAHQHFGIHNKAMLTSEMLESSDEAQRGIDVFINKHVVFEWATNEFLDTLTTGAKREVPKINNVVAFRHWISPFVQRKLRSEPNVAPWAACPEPIHVNMDVEWDRDHLDHYLKVAVLFCQWYKEQKQNASLAGKNINMVAVLAKIQAVVVAASHPHVKQKIVNDVYTPLTSKQRLAIELIKQHLAEGKKTILYAYSPKVLERFHVELKKDGIDSVLFHGGCDIAKRTKLLDSKFRYGSCGTLLSSWVGQRGLNMPEVSRIVMYNRDWNASTEGQAIARTTRPDQKEHCIVKYPHLRGSIDIYQAMLVDWKRAAANAGLDWGNGTTETEEFRHLDYILEEFCKATLNMSSHDAVRLRMAS